MQRSEETTELDNDLARVRSLVVETDTSDQVPASRLKALSKIAEALLADASDHPERAEEIVVAAEDLERAVDDARERLAPPVRRERPARNALCPCGSAKKFKHCCA